MEASVTSWFVILLAVTAANAPFFNERLFALIPLRRAVKPVWMRLLELLTLYFAVGLVAWLIESRIGTGFPQRWEFYAITGCVFLVLAFPGYVMRYLHKSHG